MTITFLSYPLSDAYLHHWLVAGPVPAPAAEPAPASLDALGLTVPPVDLGPVGALGDALADARWRYHRCRDDHFVDLTAYHPVPVSLQAFAYAQVVVPAGQSASLVLTTRGAASVWVNGQPAGSVGPGAPAPCLASQALPLELRAGANDLLVRFTAQGVAAVPFVMALRLPGLAQAHIQLPTAIEPDLLERRQSLEALAYAGTLDRYVYGYFDGDRYDKNEPIELRFPPALEHAAELTFRLQSLQGDIFQERTPKVGAGAVVPLAATFPLRGGPHHLATVPVANDYYVRQLRFDRHELFFVARTPYTVKAGATFKARRDEALADAAARRNGSFYTEVAKLALGHTTLLDDRVLRRTLAALRERHLGSERELLGAVLLLRRFARKKPRLDRELRLALEDAVLGSDFAQAAPGPEAESRQLLLAVCEHLAGHIFAERFFTRSGQPGAWHAARGAAAALAWLRQRGAFGFSAWHAPAAVEEIVAALAVLIDLTGDEALRDLAAALLDKVLFGLAVNSFEGAYGVSHGHAATATVLSARLEPTSGLQRLLWGRGNFNEHLLATVCLALCRSYELPGVIAQAALAPVDAFWGRERQVRPAAPSTNGHTEPPSQWAWSVETAVYKTRDFMLASAQDYQPGAAGQAEHLWQATLGPDAVVFVNHPANTSLDDAHRPNFWAGNGVLPRVAQWGDVLIALHRLPDDDWLGYTHAYFPATTFSEYVIEDGWAFARKGSGYLALWAANGLDFTTTGSAAYRELRSPGRENVWLCHMGQALLDGTFDDFRRKIRALDLAAGGLVARVQTLRGDQLRLLWEGPLLVNGAAQPLAPQRHIENPYCVADLPAAAIEIIVADQGVRLTFD